MYRVLTKTFTLLLHYRVLQIYHFFFLTNMDIRVSLRISRLILRVLKLKIMQASSSSEVCETRTSNL